MEPQQIPLWLPDASTSGLGPTRDGRQQETSVILAPYPLVNVLEQTWGTFLLALGFQVVVAYVFCRRPRDRAAGVLLLAASSLLSGTAWSVGLQVSDLVGSVGFW